MESPDNKLIVSVHIHKNAGMHFKRHLIKIFGDKLGLSYGRDMRVLERFFSGINVPQYRMTELDNIRVVHGHFLADLFDSFSHNIKYATFLRDPVERVISNYYFFKSNHYKHSPVCNMIADGMPLEEYAKLGSSQNVQSFFMAGKPIEGFDFVGICEEYDKSVLLFDRLFQVKGTLKNTLLYYLKLIEKRFKAKSEFVLPDDLTKNINPYKHACTYDIDDNLKDKIAELNLLDHELYKRGREHFKQNCKKYHI